MWALKQFNDFRDHTYNRNTSPSLDDPKRYTMKRVVLMDTLPPSTPALQNILKLKDEGSLPRLTQWVQNEAVLAIRMQGKCVQHMADGVTFRYRVVVQHKEDISSSTTDTQQQDLN
eukprot:PhF_6_TR4981/c0_g2_i2/m.7052